LKHRPSKRDLTPKRDYTPKRKFTEEDEVAEIVNRIWYKYDVDRSGALNRKETLRFVDDFLA
jgi:hypothetical protein|tara:strand:- start:247 stop:432 length:186 start_codon:yes stop_codon:yes gene_type:complete